MVTIFDDAVFEYPMDTMQRIYVEYAQSSSADKVDRRICEGTYREGCTHIGDAQTPLHASNPANPARESLAR